MFSDKGSLDTIKKTKGCIRFRISNKSGEMERTSYDVFNGIQLVYNDIHMSECHTDVGNVHLTDRILEIDHCREGRLECSKGEEFFYLSQGDLAINRNTNVEHNTFFPTGHYHGLTLIIDLDNAPECLSCFLKDVKIQPENIARRFCEGKDLFIARSSHHLDHIFSELYHVPEEVKTGYFKIKVLEILLFLSAFPIETAETKKSYTLSQVQLAKAVCRYLSKNMNKRICLESLAKEFHVSVSLLQNCFHGVYGESVYDYIRIQKMQSAAQMLITTEKTVLEIAGLHGYENGSKFAAAFFKVMGTTPNKYRKKGK